MELKYIKELVKLIDTTSVTEIEIEKDNTKLRIAKNSEVQFVNQSIPQPQVQVPMPAAPVVPANSSTSETNDDVSHVNTIVSPMVGTYYASPSPDSDPFVKVGDSISVGQTLCIIEAMKLMNEIKAEKSGKLLKILVDNADPVEYNQVLFHID